MPQESLHQSPRPETPQTAAPDRASSVLRNWLDTNRKLPPQTPQDSPQPATTRHPLLAGPKVRRILCFLGCQFWIVRTGAVVGAMLLLFLVFRPADPQSPLMSEPEPVFKDITIHPLDDGDPVHSARSPALPSEPDPAPQTLAATPESPTPATGEPDEAKSLPEIQTAQFTTPEQPRGDRGARLTGTIEPGHGRPRPPTRLRPRIGGRIEYISPSRN